MAHSGSSDRPLVLVTGATGYIGGRLLRPLLEAGYRVRAGARHPEVLAARAPGADAVRFDALDADSVRDALVGVDTAYYLVHSLADRSDYASLDRTAATIFAQAARDEGVRRIIYLGGLGAEAERLSDHLASRQEVGHLLAQSGVQTIEFRASIVIGSGSTSFEMVRNLVEKLPVMPTPRWVGTAAQPIAIEDVVAYLTAALDATFTDSRVFEIGGADIVSYAGILAEYARQRGLRRLIIPLPVLTPRLSAGWLALFTPIQARVGKRLALSLRNPTVVTNDDAARAFPSITPMSTAEAITRAMVNEDREVAETRWCDALGACDLTAPPKRTRRLGRLVDSRTFYAACPPEAAFKPVICLGGDTGWYAFDRLWGLRGFLDGLTGGVGSRRGRRDASCLLPGDTLDFWRVVSVEPPHRLVLQAEMRIPGRGWLSYEIEPGPAGGSYVRQTAVFDARGVIGLLYWYALSPFHAFVFNGTLRGIERECKRL